MSCCAPGAELALHMIDHAGLSREEILLASRTVAAGTRQTDLVVPGIHCGGCIERIETALVRLPGVERARVNYSTRRVTICWVGGIPPPFMETLRALGYNAHLYAAGNDGADENLQEMLRALAVAGFAAANIMLLSVSIWSGADPATRQLFHWISALLALPAIAYSGRIFFRPAWRALRRGQTNMDVPISVGVLLATAMSLYETIQHGDHAYFDASVSLLFFVLIGRTLDHMMRERARGAVKGLARLSPRGTMVVRPDETHDYVPIEEIAPGMIILLAAGERVPVDARVEQGMSDLDVSLVTGESVPKAVASGAMLQAGTLNLTQPLTIIAVAAARDSFLAEMVRLMEAAEGGRSTYRRIADRAARLYAPAVHLTAFLAFLGWFASTGDPHRAITIAVAVLIITCPCALGLAVPMVQVVAAGRLFERGIMVKDGSAMERLAEIDTVVFDKTGTLTLGRPRLASANTVDRRHLAVAAAMAAHSRHPHARALCVAAAQQKVPVVVVAEVVEHPGLGLEARSSAGRVRLGRDDWAVGKGLDLPLPDETASMLSLDGVFQQVFCFEDQPRPDSLAAIAALRKCGLAVEMLSGDSLKPVERLASALAIGCFKAGAMPRDKTSHIVALAASGHKVLMVGDGLNDAPSLVAANVSMAPGSAADVGRNAADFVFLRASLDAVPFAFRISRVSARLIRQNFILAVGYNAVAVPLAILGHVTPLIAALAMSLSSIMVIANALRLHGEGPGQGAPSPSLGTPDAITSLKLATPVRP